ncbi:hypothetical protein HK097_008825 [Rhizophlyctis rosea]|uniref:Uncharacterized protein n=1 Tax=Rhizophlyctis rosea TaxID=64517 RepID=A0AAD5SHV2_9FUNG|nr:hypothetical protein HK097_008825 [Rhizophlyctis rosea]
MHHIVRNTRTLTRTPLLQCRSLFTRTPTLLSGHSERPTNISQSQPIPDPTPENIESSMLKFNEEFVEPDHNPRKGKNPEKLKPKSASSAAQAFTNTVGKFLDRGRRAAEKEHRYDGNEADVEIDPYIHRPPEIHDPEQIAVKGNQNLREKANFKSPQN